MSKYEYNMVTIGAGSAGLVTSYICAATKAKVALIEKNKMGGDCLNTGCVPSKALIRSAKFLYDTQRSSKLGFKKTHVEFEFSDIMNRIQRIIKSIEPHDSVERYTSLGVDCYQGQATILSPHEIQVNDQILSTKNITIATGAHPFLPDWPGKEKVKLYTSDTIWSLREKPKKMTIIGGGPIGCELSQAFSRLGISVTIIENQSSLLSNEDSDVSDSVTQSFRDENINLKLNCSVTGFRIYKGKQYITYKQNGQNQEIESDCILLALGRKPNTEGFGLNHLDVPLNPNGTIQVDKYLRTINYKNIYACGDVAGPYQFTHTASHQAWYCAVNSMIQPFWGFKVNYHIIPRATYIDPEVARVGLNEKEAHQQNIPYQVTSYSIKDSDRAITDEEAKGFIKVLTPPGKDKVLGVTIVGPRAGELITEYVLAMKHNIGLNKILSTIHTYPTLMEINKSVAGQWRKKQTSDFSLSWGERINRWRRSF